MWVARWMLMLGAASWIWLFIYNSGLGYDAIELLVPARHIADGYELYTLTTAKPFASYLVLAGLDRCGLDLNHLTVSTLVTLQQATVVAVVWWYYQSFVDRRYALLAATLVALAGLFMELNFLVV